MHTGVVRAAAAAFLLVAAPGFAKGSDDTVVAIVGGQRITYAEIRRKVGTQLAQMEAKYRIERRNVESETLRELVEQALIEGEAKKRGLTVEALLDAEIDKKVSTPTEEEVKKTYEQAKAQVDLPLNVLRPRIEEFLRKRAKRELRAKLLDGLRTAAGVQETLPLAEIPVIDVPEAGNPAKGPADAPVRLVVFSDFECPYCARVVPTLHELYKKYDGKIRMVFRDFPLEFHANARRAAEAAQCANDQGRFWEYHDRLFAHQEKLAEKDLVEHAKAIQIDSGALEKCLQSGKYKDEVTRDYKDGERLGVSGTPAIFVNGVMLSGAQPYKAFADLVDAFLQRKAAK